MLSVVKFFPFQFRLVSCRLILYIPLLSFLMIKLVDSSLVILRFF